MSERTVFACDGCGAEITTPQPAVTIFIDQRFARSTKGGNYHCCSVSCLVTYANKIAPPAPNPPPPRGEIGGVTPARPANTTTVRS